MTTCIRNLNAKYADDPTDSAQLIVLSLEVSMDFWILLSLETNLGLLWRLNWRHIFRISQGPKNFLL